MRHILLIVLALVGGATAAVNKNLTGGIATSGNDRPVLQVVSDSLVGTSDTAFLTITGGSFFKTNTFNSIRNPIAGSNLGKPSSVVSTNPDSIVCNFMLISKDADSSGFSAGIYTNVGSDASPRWTLYGSTVLTGNTVQASMRKFRVTSPFVVGRSFRPWVTVTEATDTLYSRFAECGAK